MMHFSADGMARMQKQYNNSLVFIQFAAAVVLPSLTFVIIYLSTGFDLRFYTPSMAFLIGPVLFVGMSAVLTFVAVLMYIRGRLSRMFWVLSVCMWLASVWSFILADKTYWTYTNPYFNYEDMALYINIDPALDRGQSYMDAGQIYFKENTYVSRKKAIAFKNGDTYCVAPIVREPLQNQEGTNQLQTLSGFVLPKSGTVDFWAVGVNCCGVNGDDFTCGDVTKTMARSGMRIIDDNKRNMYLLAVQEWSATTGLPVHHPLFFSWTVDPISFRQNQYNSAWGAFTHDLITFIIVDIICAFLVMMLLRKLRVY